MVSVLPVMNLITVLFYIRYFIYSSEIHTEIVRVKCEASSFLQITLKCCNKKKREVNKKKYILSERKKNKAVFYFQLKQLAIETAHVSLPRGHTAGN